MTIDPFVCGVLATLATEFVIMLTVIIVSIVRGISAENKNGKEK